MQKQAITNEKTEQRFNMAPTKDIVIIYQKDEVSLDVGRYAKQYGYEGVNVNLEEGFIQINFIGRDDNNNNRPIVKLYRLIPLAVVTSVDVIW